MPEPHDAIDDLVAQLRDGEGGDKGRLAELLRDQPDQRERFLKQMFLTGLLREAFGESEGESRVIAPPRRRWLFPALAAAAALVFAAVVLWPRIDVDLVATIESAEGSVLVDGNKVSEGARVEPGQEIKISSPAGLIAFHYADGTRVLIDGEAQLSLADTDYKRLEVASGVLRADVAKQPEGKPMRIVTPSAELEIVGTRFVVGAGDDETDLNVTEGLVRMKRTDGDTVDVAAGERARFAAGYTLQISELPEVPDAWRRDFESSEDLLGDEQGMRITEGLPAGSNAGMATKPFVLPADGKTYHGIQIRDLVDGYCTVTEDTHLELTFRTREWFNLFISTVGTDEDGQLQVRKFKLGASNLYRWADVQERWHTLVVPITAFTERTGIRQPAGSPGRRPEHDGYGGPPPEPGHVIYSIMFGHPSPHRDLQVDAVGFSPNGPGEKVLTTLGR